jgi:hypothetical protein
MIERKRPRKLSKWIILPCDDIYHMTALCQEILNLKDMTWLQVISLLHTCEGTHRRTNFKLRNSKMVPCMSYTVRRKAVILLDSATCQDDGKRVSVKGVLS